MYYCPAGSRTNVDAAAILFVVYVHNPNSSNVTVFYQTSVSNGSVTVAAGDTVPFTMPYNTAGKLYTTNAMPFIPVGVMDDGDSRHEWATTLMPEDS